MRLATILLVLALMASLGWGALNWLEKADAQGILANRSAWNGYAWSLAKRDCLTEPVMRAEAEARGWAVDRDVSGRRGIRLGAHDTHDQIAKVVVVHVEPPLPFAKEQGVAFHFGRDGCLLG